MIVGVGVCVGDDTQGMRQRAPWPIQSAGAFEKRVGGARHEHVQEGSTNRHVQR